MKYRKTGVLLGLVLVLAAWSLHVPLSSALTWSSDIRLTTSTDAEIEPSVHQLADGAIWVVFARLSYGNFDLFYRTSQDFGASWSNSVRLTTASGPDTWPSLTQAIDNTIWVFWASNRSLSYDIYYKKSSNYGLTWTNDVRMTNDSYDDYAPSAFAASDGTVWFAWTRLVGLNFEIFYRFSSDSGLSWSNETRLTTDAGADKSPSIARMKDGRVWVVWSSERTGDSEIFYKRYDGFSWSSDIRLTYNSDYLDSNPAVLQARDGTIWIVWASREAKDVPSATDDIYYKTSADNGATWSDTVQLTVDSNDDMNPSIAQVSDKKIWVAWGSDRIGQPQEGNYDIWYKVSTPVVIHDLAVKSVTPSPTWVIKGQVVNIDVVIENRGDQIETSTVSCYANSTFVGSTSVTVPALGLATVTIPWATGGFMGSGLLITNATVASVPGELAVNLDNNSRKGGTVWVELEGDVNHDGAVNIVDVVIVANAYGSQPGHPNWNAGADLYKDDLIDLLDLIIVCRNYGKE